jgi:large subunit ribosomal protein L32
LGVPKRKHSKARTASRRAEWLKIDGPRLSECPQCHELKIQHRVCAKCGYYNERKVISEKVKKK